MNTENDKKICPICEQENNCGLLQGKSQCWCFNRKFPSELLELVSEKELSCICDKCLEKFKSKSELKIEKR